MSTPETLAAYRQVLHQWAAKQLETRSDHTGPFTITEVRVESVCGYSVGSDYLEVGIGFTHEGCTAYPRHPDDHCTVGWWSMPDTTDTVAMLNELLALGDQP